MTTMLNNYNNLCKHRTIGENNFWTRPKSGLDCIEEQHWNHIATNWEQPE
jgi:hypothetical protein